MRRKTNEFIKSEFRKHDKEHPNYVLCIPGTSLGKDNHLKIEVNPYNSLTIKEFIEDSNGEEERDNRIRHLFKFINKEYDELAVDRVVEYLTGKYGLKAGTLKKISGKEKAKAKEQEEYKFDQSVMAFKEDYIAMAEKFFLTQPFFYDKHKIWWLWNTTTISWEMVDEVDLINQIRRGVGQLIDVTKGGIFHQIITSLELVGRDKKPKEAPKKWIQFKEKAFSLKSKKVYQVKSNYFFTNPIPWDLGETSNTPTMDKLFKEWVGEKYVPTLYEIISYCCLNDYPMHLAFCFIGNGRNGKTQFQKLLTKFIGIKNITSTELDAIASTQCRFETFKMYKKLVAIMGETNFGVMDKSSTFKKLTGGDMIGYEKKGKDPFDDYSYAKLIINSNSLPTSEDTSEGFYRRWLIIDFPNQFKEGKDIINTIPEQEYINLAKKVTEILPKLIEKGEFTNQGTIEERKNKYIFASNPLNLFVENCCYEYYEGFIRYSELYTAYCKFLKTINRRIVGKREFTKSLEVEGHEIRKTTKNINGLYVSDRYIEGLAFKENYDSYDFMTDINISPICKNPNLETENKVITVINKEEHQKPLDVEKIYHKCTICGGFVADCWIKGKPYCEICAKPLLKSEEKQEIT